MISLYLRPDKTQLVQAKFSKDGDLDIEMTQELPPFWNGRQESYGSQGGLDTLFRTVKKVTKGANDEISIVLPDTLFTLISCFRFYSQNQITQSIQEKLPGMNLEDFVILKPMEVSGGNLTPYVTVYVIRKRIISEIVDAAKREKVTVNSIEPASIAFIRCNQIWDIDYPIVEMFKDEAAIVTFNPYCGIFRTDCPHISEEEILADPATGNVNITQIYSRNDFLAGETFASASAGYSYLVLSENHNLLNQPSIRHMIPDKIPVFPEFVISDLTDTRQVHWMSCVGTLLQYYKDDLILYKMKSAFTKINNANLLPEDLQEDARNKQKARVLRKSLQVAVMVLAVIVGIESIGTFYFSAINEIPGSIKSDYEQSKNDLSLLSKEMNSIHQAVNEDLHVPEAYKAILNSRPNNCGFSELTIGSANGAVQGNTYVKVKAISTDQMVFNDLISGLQDNELFSNPTISSIQAVGQSGGMTADINMGKGGVANGAK